MRALVLGLALGLTTQAGAASNEPAAPSEARILIFVERDGDWRRRESAEGGSILAGPGESGEARARFGASSTFSAATEIVYTAKLEQLADGARLRTERAVKQGFVAKVSPQSIDGAGDLLVDVDLSDTSVSLQANPDGSQTPVVETALSRKARVALTPYAQPRMVARGQGSRVFMAADFGPEPRPMFRAQTKPESARSKLFPTMRACLDRLILDAQTAPMIQAGAQGKAHLSCSAEIVQPVPAR